MRVNCNSLILRLFQLRLGTFTYRSSSTLNNTQTLSTSQNIDEIYLSDSCVSRLKLIGEGDQLLRIYVDGGGCSGFQYKFEFVDKISDQEEKDKIFEREGVRVVIDKDSLELLKGSTIDYQDELIKSSFRIVKNPNAEQGCSCGTSFSIK
ncbi:unnamed protein product [Didymodactylos carnosus]|uniref:Iron-sulfur cluster assembly 2 homolog, mitochondrial n=1 Tax=Didymodactylos carnosus TaxID=1234261 RepID=A0A814JHK1_9BILA|nr:unnamed protein product [Didymodactylos carnosus]CAF1037773.1 unnamed protein product [Didymodactylos carnosus]CAF3762252.1 unnamed protein product [Didymodactylos carnosus]CAF3808256.1 unnamed protein product [Didymodactylos carnosus]